MKKRIRRWLKNSKLTREMAYHYYLRFHSWDLDEYLIWQLT